MQQLFDRSVVSFCLIEFADHEPEEMRERRVLWALRARSGDGEFSLECYPSRYMKFVGIKRVCRGTTLVGDEIGYQLVIGYLV